MNTIQPIVACGLALGLWSTGCADTRTETIDLPLEATTLELVDETGNITIVPAARGASPEVVADITGADTLVTGTLEGDRFVVRVTCPDHALTCVADLDASIPSGLALVLESASGDVRVDGVDASSLAVNAGSGNLVGDGLTIASVRVDAGSGDVRLGMSAPPDFVSIDAGSGNVDLAVPAGRYALDLSSGSGNTSVSGVEHDPAESTLFARSGSGDVTVAGR